MVDHLLRVHIQSQRAFGPWWTLSYNKIILRSQTRQLLLGKLNNGLYKVQAAPVLSNADPAIETSLVSQADHAVLWHRRFGHAGHSTLAKMSRTDTVQGRPSPQVFEQQLQFTKVCTPRAEGKMKRESFHFSPNRASTKIEKLHVDLAGPFESSSGGANYYMVIVDEFSGYKIVKPLAKKLDAADAHKSITPALEKKYQSFVVHAGLPASAAQKSLEVATPRRNPSRSRQPPQDPYQKYLQGLPHNAHINFHL